ARRNKYVAIRTEPMERTGMGQTSPQGAAKPQPHSNRGQRRRKERCGMPIPTKANNPLQQAFHALNRVSRGCPTLFFTLLGSIIARSGPSTNKHLRCAPAETGRPARVALG